MEQEHPRLRKKPAFKGDAYERTLTPEELDQFHELICSNKTMTEIRAAAIPWRSGQYQGQPPSRYTIYRIRARLDLDDMLAQIEGTSMFMEETRKRLNALVKGTEAEHVLDQAIALIGQEVIHWTLKRLNPTARTASAKLLLKRADQRRVDRRLDLVESELNKIGKKSRKRKLSAKERRKQIHQVFGIL